LSSEKKLWGVGVEHGTLAGPTGPSVRATPAFPARSAYIRRVNSEFDKEVLLFTANIGIANFHKFSVGVIARTKVLVNNHDILTTSDIFEQRRLTFNGDECEDRRNRTKSGLLSEGGDIFPVAALECVFQGYVEPIFSTDYQIELKKHDHDVGIDGVP
jgi:hypothetical protein